MGNAYGVLTLKLAEIYFNLICCDNKGKTAFEIKDRWQPALCTLLLQAMFVARKLTQ